MLVSNHLMELCFDLLVQLTMIYYFHQFYHQCFCGSFNSLILYLILVRQGFIYTDYFQVYSYQQSFNYHYHLTLPILLLFHRDRQLQHVYFLILLLKLRHHHYTIQHFLFQAPLYYNNAISNFP